MVVGAGGLGFPVLSYLAAAGVGHIVIFEYDTVNITNLNRQLLYSEADNEKPKIDAAVQKLKLINPYIDITPVAVPFSEDNARRYSANMDLIIDCVDNFDTRLQITQVAHHYKKTMIHGAISGFLGTVAVFNSKYGPCFRCVYREKPDSASPSVFGAMAGMIGSLQAIECIKYLIGFGKTDFNKILIIDTETGQFDWITASRWDRCPVCS
jgi:molybdopterin/thiamine biosynthesis adenylyltransferase